VFLTRKHDLQIEIVVKTGILYNCKNSRD